ncbi:MAG: histidine--tRNA ligase [Nitrospirae bacterium]|nr:histidine--tRNA ligase [Nitrospirota bacterium]
MSANVESERGFRDILGAEAESLERLVAAARNHFERYGYRPIILPVVEPTDLFARGVGATTDIVEKEMFFVSDGHTHADQLGDLCLRPEGTASAVRAYIDQGFDKSDPLQKFYYSGPMFRNERPQKGRYRQFHQIGAELFGAALPAADAEVIAMLRTYLESVVSAGRFTLRLNSLGCAVCRPEYVRRLKTFLAANRDALCEDCRRRIETNPLRVLDCKNESCRAILREAPHLTDSWCEACKSHFDSLLQRLKTRKVDAEWDQWLVRGLDYYTRTVFEVTAEGLGAQNAVAAGGRYDGLVELLGGVPTPALGFAIGVERLALVTGANSVAPRPKIFLASTSETTRTTAEQWADTLRRELPAVGTSVEVWTDLGGQGLKRQLQQAGKLGCAFTLILGDREVSEGKVILRDMKKSTQEDIELSIESLMRRLRERLGL